VNLRELDAVFLRYEDGDCLHVGEPPDVRIEDADAVMFLCPVCYTKNGGKVGTHRVICNRPRVPLGPNRVGPGRWEFKGAGIDDLTLVAGSSSIKLEGGCAAHFFVTNGQIA